MNPYWNESFVFLIDEMDMKRVYIDVTVCDYDLIGSGDPIGKIMLGWNQSKLYKPGFKHWKEVLENPRRPIIKWHVLQVKTKFLKMSSVTKASCKFHYFKSCEMKLPMQ